MGSNTLDEDESSDEEESTVEGESAVDGTPSRATDSNAKSADEQYCSSCGEAIKKEAEICPHCGVRASGGSGSGEKEPGIAAVISLIIPGGGQLYNEQITRGALILGGYIAFWMVTLVLMFVLIGFLLMLFSPIFHLFAAWDAYSQAKKINSGEVTV